MKSRSGFTLLELLTVMVIMFLLMGMGTVAMRGLVRGAGISGAVANVKGVLTQARQYAVTRQQRTYVIFSKNGETNGMAVCAKYAESAINDGNTVITETPLPWDTNTMSLVGGVVYNLGNGLSGEITTHLKQPHNGLMSDELYCRESRLDWGVGDDVGFEVAEKRFLPSGIEFYNIKDKGTYVVVFNPDGTTAQMGGEDYEIELKEMFVAGAVSTILEVDGLTGWVKVK